MASLPNFYISLFSCLFVSLSFLSELWQVLWKKYIFSSFVILSNTRPSCILQVSETHADIVERLFEELSVKMTRNVKILIREMTHLNVWQVKKSKCLTARTMSTMRKARFVTSHVSSVVRRVFCATNVKRMKWRISDRLKNRCNGRHLNMIQVCIHQVNMNACGIHIVL